MSLRRPAPRFVIGVVLSLFAVAGAPTSSAAGSSVLTPGALFTETNDEIANAVLAFQRAANGTLTLAGAFPTGGRGRIGNPPSGFPAIDSAGAVELSSDGDNRSCLFAVNGGSNTVSSFLVRPEGLRLADLQPTEGSRPVSLTSSQIGRHKRILYVLNSDIGSASILGYYVSASCGLAPIPGSLHPTTNPTSLPAQIAFNQHGNVLTVSERLANGRGDLDIFPIDASGMAGTPTAEPSVGDNPYGMAWNNQDILTVVNQSIVNPAGSSVTTYKLTNDDTLVPLTSAPSPGGACCDVFTNNGRYVYVTNPLAQLFGDHSVTAFSVDRDGTLAFVDGKDTNHNAVQDAVSHDSKYLYVLSDQLTPNLPASAINVYAIDRQTGMITPIQSVELTGNSISGLAVW